MMIHLEKKQCGVVTYPNTGSRFSHSLATCAVIPDGLGNVCDGSEPRKLRLFYKGIPEKGG